MLDENECLTLKQMYEHFPGEWLVMGEPEKDKWLAVKSSVVLFHHRDCDLVYRKAIELRPGRFAFHLTGKMLEGTAVAV